MKTFSKLFFALIISFTAILPAKAAELVYLGTAYLWEHPAVWKQEELHCLYFWLRQKSA